MKLATTLTHYPDSDDDDDITLQDLVALETMDDADDVEADQFFTLSSNTNPLEPFMNSIIHNSGAADDAGGFLRCEQCGQHFVSSIEFRRHKEAACPAMVATARAQLSKLSKLSKGKKGKSSSSAAAKNRAKSSTSSAAAAAAAAAPPTTAEEPMSSSSDLAANSNVDAKWQLPDVIKTEVKSEAVLDSASQPVLGGTGDHWKCNQCKVVFETGPELLDHLDQIKQGWIDFTSRVCLI